MRRLVAHQIDHASARREITRVVEAAVKRDYRRFDGLCVMTASKPETAGFTM